MTVAASLVLHAAVILWFVHRSPPEPARFADVEPVPAATNIDPIAARPPMEVVLLDEAALDLAPHAPRRRTLNRAPAGRALPSPETTAEPARAPDSLAPTAPALGRPRLAMRSPTVGVSRELNPRLPTISEPGAPQEADRVELAPPGSIVGAPPGNGQPRATGEADVLQRQRDGTYRTEEEDFTATVDRDGGVTFDDRPNIRPGNGSDPAAGTMGLDPSTTRERGSIGMGGVGGTMDATDFVMRQRGIDPHAYKKLQYLDRTREQRVAIGKEHRREQLSRSAVLMRRNIEQLWARTEDPRERKEGLFELWDECTESGDAEGVAGGAQARAVVVGFVRSRLHGAHAYTPRELAALNARRQSTATFAPYD